MGVWQKSADVLKVRKGFRQNGTLKRKNNGCDVLYHYRQSNLMSPLLSGCCALRKRPVLDVARSSPESF